MSDRPAYEIIQSLRATLRKIEEEFASTDDQPQIAELKRILLLRIADLEFVGATVEMANVDAVEHPDSVLFAAIEEDPDAA